MRKKINVHISQKFFGHVSLKINVTKINLNVMKKLIYLKLHQMLLLEGILLCCREEGIWRIFLPSHKVTYQFLNEK